MSQLANINIFKGDDDNEESADASQLKSNLHGKTLVQIQKIQEGSSTNNDSSNNNAVNLYVPLVILKKDNENASTTTTTTTSATTASGKKKNNKKKEDRINIPAPQQSSQSLSGFEALGLKPNYEPPSAYIRHRNKKTSKEELIKKPEYELTKEDILWLNDHPKYSKKGNQTLNPDLMEKLINIFEIYTDKNAPVTISQVEMTIQNNLGIIRTSTNRVIEDIYQYWITKRSKLRKPLLRRFWPATSSDDTNPNLTFRPREKERYKLRRKRGNDMESFEKMKILQRDFRIVKDILTLIKKREKLHWMTVKLDQDDFEQTCHDIMLKFSKKKNKNDKRDKILVRDDNPLPEIIKTINYDKELNTFRKSMQTRDSSIYGPGGNGGGGGGNDFDDDAYMPSNISSSNTNTTTQRQRKKRRARVNSAHESNQLKAPGDEEEPLFPSYLLERGVSWSGGPTNYGYKNRYFNHSVHTSQLMKDRLAFKHTQQQQKEHEILFKNQWHQPANQNNRFIKRGRYSRNGRIVFDHVKRRNNQNYNNLILNEPILNDNDNTSSIFLLENNDNSNKFLDFVKDATLNTKKTSIDDATKFKIRNIYLEQDDENIKVEPVKESMLLNIKNPNSIDDEINQSVKFRMLV